MGVPITGKINPGTETLSIQLSLYTSTFLFLQPPTYHYNEIRHRHGNENSQLPIAVPKPPGSFAYDTTSHPV